MNGFYQTLIRELKREALHRVRKPELLLNPLLFFVLVVSLFPLALSIEPSLLHRLAPGLIWMSVLLAMLLPIESLFARDDESGVLEWLIVEQFSLSAYVCAKLMMLWLLQVLPLIVTLPLLAVMLGLQLAEFNVLVLSLLCGTPIICVLLTILAALTLRANQRGAILSLLFLPLTVPIIIFAVGAVLMVMQAMSALPLLLILTALLLISLAFGPWVSALALSLAID